MSGKYEDHSWEELPEEAKAAAAFLGYNEDMWENDTCPDGLAESSWADLTDEQKAAAATLGYDEALWDAS